MQVLIVLSGRSLRFAFENSPLRLCFSPPPLKIVLYCLNTKHISVIFATQQEDTPAHLLLLQCHSCSPSNLLSSLCCSVPGPPSDSVALAHGERVGVWLE